MNISPKKQLEGMKPYPLGMTMEEIQIKYGPSHLRKRSDNENVYGYSGKVAEELKNTFHTLELYPDGLTQKLIEGLAMRHQLPKDYFLIGNGSEELIRLLARAFISEGDEAIMADVTFPIYRSNIIIEGGNPVLVPLVDGYHHLEGILDAINENTKMIFICNPNNPTGTCVNPSHLLNFIQKVPSHILVVLDEAYKEYMEQSQQIDSIGLVENHMNLVILRTFSKIYGLAALRVGYGMMHPFIIEQLVKVKEVFNVNGLGQLAATAALSDHAFISSCAEKNQVERDYLSKQLTSMNIAFFPSQTNFLFIFNLRDASGLKEAMLHKGLVARFFPFPQFNGCMRYTLGTREDQDDLLNVLQHFYRKEGAVNHGNQTSIT
jgi:histidinol-phosphate aminotransferase